MAYNHFDYVPSTVDRKRSVFKYDKSIATAGYLGFLYPVCKPIPMMPGSSISLDLAAEIRSGALTRPMMDEMLCDFFSFFVPNRIVWEHWKQFVGAVDDVLFNSLTSYNVPSIKYGLANSNTFQSGSELFQWTQCIACHFELPMPDRYSGGIPHPSGGDTLPVISALPFRGYTFIWNTFFRPEQLVAPLVFGKTDDGWAGQNMESNLTSTITFNGATLYLPISLTYAAAPTAQLGGAILPVFRAHRDLYTSCLPAPSLETLNLLAGLQAPVGFFANGSGTTSSGSTSVSSSIVSSGTTFTDGQFFKIPISSPVSQFNSQPVMADLNQVALTVNNYRETIMLQNYYDVLNRAGSRYDEIIRNIFGVTTSNAVTDIPELIVHKRFTIYRNQVIATAETVNSSDQTVNPVGSQSAYIDTVVRDNFFTRSTTEHGYIHMMWAIRPARIRSQNAIEPDWRKLSKFDLYYPQFDGMGDVARYGYEKFVSWSTPFETQKAVIFGYQEYGADWKYQKNSGVGWLDQNITGCITGFTLSEKLSAVPALVAVAYGGSASFISCISECEAFANCCAIPDPTLTPQFVLDIRLTGTITHPMPVYNIPGQGALL